MLRRPAWAGFPYINNMYDLFPPDKLHICKGIEEHVVMHNPQKTGSLLDTILNRAYRVAGGEESNAQSQKRRAAVTREVKKASGPGPHAACSAA